ncbi:MAG: MFS transporter [Sphingobacteriales bacterium]|jgi:hypothetical protein|nr:MFS transporter [Sphingobacteriales bacterium]
MATLLSAAKVDSSESKQSGFTSVYLLCALFVFVLGGYLFGFDFAVLAGALPFLKEQFAFNEYWVGFGAIPSGLFLLGVIWLPESLKWLLKEGKDSQAVAVLNKIGSDKTVVKTLSGMKSSLNASN